MTKLLIYIGEGIKFDLDETVRIINSIDGVTDAKSGDFIGAVFECLFASDAVIVRISKDCETITADGPIEKSLIFIFQLQSKIPAKLWLIDMNYSFNLEVGKFKSIDEIMSAMNELQ